MGWRQRDSRGSWWLSLPTYRAMGTFSPCAPLPQAGLGSTDSAGDEWKEPRQPGVGEASPSAMATGSPGTPTYWEDLEEVDWGEAALLVSLVRRQRHRDIFQVLREQNYEKNSPRRRENQTMRQSGSELPACPHINCRPATRGPRIPEDPKNQALGTRGWLPTPQQAWGGTNFPSGSTNTSAAFAKIFFQLLFQNRPPQWCITEYHTVPRA